MMLIETLSNPGVYPLLIPGPAHQLEVELTIPEHATTRFVAVLGHPHSLYGGTMHNKVVTTLARAFKECQIPTIRFNFRGVGQSLGNFDAGIGESEDMLFLVRSWLSSFKDTIVFFAGFSFGSFVAYRAAALYQQTISKDTFLITIAPSVIHFNYAEFADAPSPWIIIQGEQDEVVAAKDVIEFAHTRTPELPVTRFATAGHFFHGQLIELKSFLVSAIRSQVMIHD